MSNAFVTGSLLWLCTYALHSTLVLGGVWAFERLRPSASPALREALWRVGLLAAIVTATLQVSGVARPLAGYVPVSVGRSAVHLAPVQTSVPAMGSSTRRVIYGDESDTPTAVGGSASGLLPPSAGVARDDRRTEAAGTAPEASRVPRLDRGSVLLPLWLVGVLLLTIRIAHAVRAARRELGDRTPIVRGLVFERIQALAHEAGIRRLPALSMSTRIAGPLTLPTGEVCIPDWAQEKLSPAQLDAMLAHELAHVLRRDPLWLLAALIVQTVFFFQPLNALARRRLTLLAEFAADDWSAKRTGNGRALAECLAELVEIGVHASPVGAAAMAAGHSYLIQRVQRLLNGRVFEGVLSMKTKILILVTAFALSGVLPGLAQNTDDAPRRASGNIQTDDDGDVSIDYRADTNDYRLSVEGEGNLELAPDGSGVTALSDGSYLDVRLDRDGTERRVRFEGDDGDITRRFWVEGDEQPWGADAERFVAEAMPIVFRETGIDAEERVAWVLEARGHDGLLDELDMIGSDFIQRSYVVHYAESTSIPDGPFQRLMSIVGEDMGSDFELRNALTTVYGTQQPMGVNLTALIGAAESIGSDFEARTLLGTVAQTMPSGPEALTAYLDLAGTIGSDFEMRQALLPAVTRADLADAQLARAIEMAGGQIGSDFELRSLLSAAASRAAQSEALAQAYISASETIGSDFEHRQALTALASSGELSAASWRSLLQSAENIGSDFECASLLSELAARLPPDEAVAAAYRIAMETVGSDFEYGRAARALDGASL